jgi:hypothetical protein
MSLKALADAVLERDTRTGQARDTPAEMCPTDDIGGGAVVPASGASDVATSAVIQTVFRPAMPWPELLAAVKPQSPEFSACPECRQARYWISPRGKVVCGKCGEVRFILVAIQYHPVG